MDKKQQNKSVLSNEFTFYFSCKKDEQRQNKENWNNMIKSIGKFNTVEDFWAYYQHMARPSTIPDGSQFYLFCEDIRPEWEHQANKNGGRFVIRIKKQFANKFWEDLVLGLIGGQCVERENLCGLNLGTRGDLVIIYLWIKDLQGNKDKNLKIKNWIIETLGLNENTYIEFKDHPRDDAK